MTRIPIYILGVKVHPLQVPELHQEIKKIIQNKEHALILNVNVNCLNLAYQNRWLIDFLNSAEIVFCDGAGVLFGARILGYHIPQRITYADWMWELASFAADNSFSLFLLGGKPKIADIAASALVKKYPNLLISGTHHGYFDKKPGSVDNQTVIDLINSTKPNILVTSFGMPLQEQWLKENWDKLEVNVALTGGAVLDYVSGTLKRAPRILTDHGLEWLGRMIIEPRRLWKRYILGNPIFLWRIVLQKLGFLRV